MPPKKRARQSHVGVALGVATSVEPFPFATFTASAESGLHQLLSRLAEQRSYEVGEGRKPAPIPKDDMDDMVKDLYAQLPVLALPPLPDGATPEAAQLRTDRINSFNEFRRATLQQACVSLADSVAYPVPGSPFDLSVASAKHQLLFDALDIALTCVELQYATPDAAVLSIEELLETTPVEEAKRVFGYLERRAARLTKGMVPERGPTLVFLRMQNNLLRRLSKSQHTVFCGRILAFLASIFPISERSGVNLRGTFNTGNATVFERDEHDARQEDVVMKEVNEVKEGGLEGEANEQTRGDNAAGEASEKTQAEVAATALAEEHRRFYTTFWSLQNLLSNPPELFKEWKPSSNIASTTAVPAISSSRTRTTTSNSTLSKSSASGAALAQPSTPNLAALRQGITQTLEVFAAATKKEIELKGAGESKCKGEEVDLNNEEAVKEHYFFPKYLTQRNLLDLEIADPYFRRQVLTQFLIVLGYIRSFSPEEKALRLNQSKPNRLDPNYVYEPSDEGWVKELLGKTWKEIDATPPNGPLFARTIQQIIKRDQNWILWKAGSCQDFSRPPLNDEDRQGALKTFKSLTAQPARFPHRVGTPALSKLWVDKVTKENIQSIDPLRGVPDLTVFKDMIKEENAKIEERKMDLEMERKPTDEETLKQDEVIKYIEGRKMSLSWRALRIAQASYLQYFGKIGLGDFEQLMAQVEAKQSRLNRAAALAAGKPAAESSQATTPLAAERTEDQSATEGEKLAEGELEMDRAKATDAGSGSVPSLNGTNIDGVEDEAREVEKQLTPAKRLREEDAVS